MSARSPGDPSPTERSAVVAHQPAEGTILLPDGRRAAAWPEIFLRTLHRSLAQASPEHASHLLYRAGYEWGLQDLLHLSHRAREEFDGRSNLDLWQMDAPFVFERWSAPLAAAGWGTFKFDRFASAETITVVELQNSAVAAALTAITPDEPKHEAFTDPICHLYAGLFAGALSFYDRVELHAVETECVALGYPCCRFLVGPGPVIDRAENARGQGATHDAIVHAALTPVAPAATKTEAPPAPSAPAKAGKIPWGKK